MAAPTTYYAPVLAPLVDLKTGLVSSPWMPWFTQRGGLVLFGEVTIPPVGIVDTAIVYAEDDGFGKTRLMVQFGTGAAQQIAIEP